MAACLNRIYSYLRYSRHLERGTVAIALCLSLAAIG